MPRRTRGCQGHTNAFQSSYVNDAKVRVISIQVIEFAKTFRRGISVNVLEKEFAGTLAADARDVNFYLGHIETQFRIFPKPLANLGEHLQGICESGVNVRVIGKSYPPRAPMTGEHPAPDGVLRQTVSSHFHPITLLTSGSANNVMSASTVVGKPIVALSAVHGPEVTQERLELVNGGDRVTRLHSLTVVGLRSDTHECVKGSLTAHFLKGIPDVSVDENCRIVEVLVLPRQIM
jgi:hypothetical protein